ncbi:MAG: hypothetical protein IJB35_00655 [Oscillospiraceae bacterium]|nr:hypothetical protein [Oscillospiraceae bacterium]
MVPITHFSFQNEQWHDYIQPECPIYVHRTRQCTHLRSGMPFLQLRMVNRGEHTVKTVSFRVDGLDGSGKVCYTLRGLVMGDCNAPPQSVFGEGRLFALQQTAQQIRIRVEQVIFADGMSWRRRGGQEPMEIGKSNWKRCSCAMPNAPGIEQCILCGKQFPLPAQESTEEETVPLTGKESKPVPVVYRERPAPIVREKVFVDEQQNEEEEEQVPLWLVVLLGILGAFALAALLYFGLNLFGNG